MRVVKLAVLVLKLEYLRRTCYYYDFNSLSPGRFVWNFTALPPPPGYWPYRLSGSLPFTMQNLKKYVPSQWWEIIQNANMIFFYVASNKLSTRWLKYTFPIASNVALFNSCNIVNIVLPSARLASRSQNDSPTVLKLPINDFNELMETIQIKHIHG